LKQLLLALFWLRFKNKFQSFFYHSASHLFAFDIQHFIHFYVLEVNATKSVARRGGGAEGPRAPYRMFYCTAKN